MDWNHHYIKILSHFKFFDKNDPTDIVLGNINVFREFNDVRDVVNCYFKLMKSNKSSIIVNICSGRKISISKVLEIAFEYKNCAINIISDDKHKRKNELVNLQGDDTLLSSIIRNHIFSSKLAISIVINRIFFEIF